MKSIPRIIRIPDYNEDIDKADIKVEKQCNCACSNSSMIRSESVRFMGNPISDFYLGLNLQQISLDEENKVVYALPKDAGINSIAVLNKDAWDILNAFQQPDCWEINHRLWYQDWSENVVNNIMNDFVALGFLSSPSMPPPSVFEVPDILEAWLHITDRCNLRCHYCFLPHDNVDMSLETGRSSIDAIFRSAITHKYPKIKLKFAGGEAMLRFPFILELFEYASKLGKLHNIAVDGVILSNGTLITPEIVNLMKSYKLRLMISVDGLDESHDVQRPYAGGRASSTDVVRGVDIATEMGLIPHISITVSNLNAGKLPELIEWVLKRSLLFSINFYRENEFSAPRRALTFAEGNIIAGMQAAFRVIRDNLPRSSLLPCLVDLADLSSPHLHTCGVGQSYLVFNHLGEVSKCHMQMKLPITTIKVHDPLAVIRADTTGIQNIPVDQKEDCKECEWRYWCSGGCPMVTHRATGRYDVKSPNCNIYKSLYPEVVFLEGLRLLKWYG